MWVVIHIQLGDFDFVTILFRVFQQLVLDQRLQSGFGTKDLFNVGLFALQFIFFTLEFDFFKLGQLPQA